MNRKEYYDLFLKEWGLESQYNQVLEEMAELTQAICKLHRPDKQNIKADVEEDVKSEIADVLNCVEQMEHIFGYEEIEVLRDYKLKRTVERMKKDAK